VQRHSVKTLAQRILRHQDGWKLREPLNRLIPAKQSEKVSTHGTLVTYWSLNVRDEVFQRRRTKLDSGRNRLQVPQETRMSPECAQCILSRNKIELCFFKVQTNPGQNPGQYDCMVIRTRNCSQNARSAFFQRNFHHSRNKNRNGLFQTSN
jgi:hypothetical protein